MYLLFGWGFIIPSALILPFKLMEFFDIQNTSIKFTSATLPSVVVFRTIEAMYGTSPISVELSQGSYIAYYSSLIHFQWDNKTNQRIKITKKQLIQSFLRLFVTFHTLSVALSVLMYYRFQPFSSPVQLGEYNLSLDLISPTNLANAYILTFVIYLTLLVGLEMSATIDHLQGYATTPTFRNPLFASSSISDFWGNRWNRVVQRTLKYGVFLPLRKVLLSTRAAVVITFLFSGLLHEYTWAVMFYNGDFNPSPHRVTAFFIYCGISMVLERLLSPYLGEFFKQLPHVIISTLVLLSALPVSHWHNGDWVVGGYFDHLSIGLWKIQPIKQ